MWAVVALVAAWLWLSRGAVLEMLGGSPVLLPGLIVVVMTLLAGITVVVLLLHNAADEQEHRRQRRLVPADGTGLIGADSDIALLFDHRGRLARRQAIAGHRLSSRSSFC